MKKVSFLLVFMFLTFIFIFPQDYKGRARVRGYVNDEDGNPLEGVKVKLFHTSVKLGFDVITDSGGKWVAPWIKGGVWNIDFKKAGYMPQEISVKIKEIERNPKIEITMKKVERPAITEDLRHRLDQGNVLYEEGKYEEAIKVYTNILEQFPDAHLINSNIGNAYFKMEKYGQAIQHYQKFLEKDPNNQDVILYIGNSYANQGEDEKAYEWYKKIEFEKIGDVNALYNIGTDLYINSKFDEALKYYKRAVEIQADFLDALYQLGLTYLSLGNYQEALETFENYIKQDPDSERASQVREFIEFLKKKIDDKKIY